MCKSSSVTHLPLPQPNMSLKRNMSEEYENVPVLNAYETEKQRLQQYRTATGGRHGRQEEVRTTPLFSLAVKHAIDGNTTAAPSRGRLSAAPELIPQYGLLGFHVGDNPDISSDEPLHMNVNAPNSAFICGSQGALQFEHSTIHSKTLANYLPGSGKSYTFSCMLENCLLSNPEMGNLTSPVAGVVFHYDINSSPSPAEAAHLCSRGIQVNVFVSRSNERALTKAYKDLADEYGNLQVQPLMFRSSDLSIERMNKLMAVATKDGPPPLYMEVVQRILREMAIKDDVFDYLKFKICWRMKS